jgi:hypothetical protein
MKSSTTAFRVIARKDGARVRLYSRPGNDLTRQFPLIVEALARLRTRSGIIIDGEAVDGAGAFWSPEGCKVPSGEYKFAD